MSQATPQPDDARPGVTPIWPVDGARVLSVPYYRAHRCPPGAVCDESGRERARYQPVQLSHDEAADLVAAQLAAEREIAELEPGIDAAVADLVSAEQGCTAARERLDRFVSARVLAAAYEGVLVVRRRHANDGPEDRRHRPRWLVWALVVAVVAASLYDLFFFQELFLSVLDGSGAWNEPATYVSMLPGVMIAAMLLAVGHWLAVANTRSGAHRDRTRHRPAMLLRGRRSAQRMNDDLPWPRWTGPVLFAVAVAVTVGVWAYLRAVPAYADAPPPDAFAALLLLFAASAVILKVLHHNPFADAEKDAQRRLDATRAEAERWTEECGEAASRYATAVRRLESLLDSGVACARFHAHDAWVRILRARAEHGLAGEVAPPFVTGGGDASGGTCPVFRGVDGPVVRLDPLTAARKYLAGHDIDKMRDACRGSIEALRAQGGADQE